MRVPKCGGPFSTFIKIFKLFVLLSALCCAALGQNIVDERVADKRAAEILAQMSLEEKLDYIGGINGFDIRAIPRLGIPALTMADGPLGVRNFGASTAYPAGIALAASWNESLVKRVGTAMGRDARARGAHFLLGPGVNIYRAPMCGRNFEYFGEDPFLAAQMAVAAIEGIQSQGVVATVKHFLANNQEWDRHQVSSDVDERTLREIYLPAFEASVKKAHVGAIMDSYNPVNGVHMTQNGRFNTDVLRKEWGFTGIVMSDWSATYDGVAAANGGLDLEMPYAKFMNRQTLLEALRSGAVTEATINEKVLRILSTAIRFGFMDRPQKDESIPLDDAESRKAALDAAREGIVLLKNDRNILPLNAGRVRSIAVIGPNAAEAVTGGGGSSRVKPLHPMSFYEAIRQTARDASVAYAPGVELFRQSFSNTLFTTTAEGNAKGLIGEYFNNIELQGPPSLTRTDAHIAFEWNAGSYAQGQSVDEFSARWTGYYTPTHSGRHGFHVAGDDGFRLYVDDKLVIDQWQYQGEALQSKFLELVGGRPYKIRLEYFEGTGDASIGFGISEGAEAQRLEEAKALAKKSDVVVLCLGFNATTEGEGSDRSFELPREQQALIREVLAQNKRVVVVLNAGGNVAMADWVDSVPALLHSWYPGQEGATALAEILFGSTNPSAKLPVTLERRWEENATYSSYHDPSGTKHLQYKEGVFLGYRHFEKTKLQPLFPFGFGLSYASFRYGHLKVIPIATGDDVEVTFSVTNTGKRRGAEVAQVYVSQERPAVARPVKELKAFSKVFLDPGETRVVSLRLDSRAFAYYSSDKNKWVTDSGDYHIHVGSSSGDIRISRKVRIQPVDVLGRD